MLSRLSLLFSCKFEEYRMDLPKSGRMEVGHIGGHEEVGGSCSGCLSYSMGHDYETGCV